MKNRVRKNIFLLLGIVCGLSAFAVLGYVHFMPESFEKKYVLRKSTVYVQQLAGKLELQAQTLAKTIEKEGRIRFGSLNPNIVYPCLIYSNKKLVFWPNNPAVFDLQTDLNSSGFTYKLINNKTQDWLSYSKKIWIKNKQYQIFTLAGLPVSEDAIWQNWSGLALSTQLPASKPNYHSVFSAKGDFLLTIFLPDSAGHLNPEAGKVAGGLFFLTFVFFVFHILWKAWRHGNQNRFILGLCWLLLGFGGLRILVLVFNFPLILLDWRLFYPQYYAASWLAPSLGDLLTGLLMAAVVVLYVSRFFVRSYLCRKILGLRGFWRLTMSLVCLLIGFLTLYFTFEILRTLYYNAQLGLDITKSLQFSIFNLTALSLFVCISIVFFLVHQLCARLFLQIIKSGPQAVLLGLAACLLCYLPIWLFYGYVFWLLPACSVIYWLLLWNLKLPYRLSKLGYQTYLYFFCVSVICAFLSATSLYTFNQKKIVEDKQKIASKLANKQDLLAEYLLEQAILGIKKDTFCLNILKVKSTASAAIIQSHISQQLKNATLDKYKIQIDIFEASGKHIQSGLQLSSFADSATRYARQTDYPGLWIKQPDSLGRKGYLALGVFEHFKQNNKPAGFFAISLQSQPLPASPLISEQYLLYDHTIYKQNKLIGGNMNSSYRYGTLFRTQWLDNPDLYQSGIIDQQVHHLAIKQEENNILVISSPAYLPLQALTNFSFFFVVLFGLLILLLLIYVFYRRIRGMPLYYATKIQIYLNLAFFFPLITVSVVVFIVLAQSYQDDYEQIFVQRSQQTTNALRSFLTDQMPGKSMELDLALKRMNSQAIEQSQISVFDPISGRLLAQNLTDNMSSFNNYDYLKPQVFEKLIENNQNFVLDLSPNLIGTQQQQQQQQQQQSAADVYTTMRTAQGNAIVVVAIRYAEFGNQLNNKATRVIALVLNCFTLTFIAFLMLSYPASHLLVGPLQLMTYKLTRTNLSGNEPVEWHSNDEIGLLVSAYNRMLDKLETGRQALANAEKENAWREMARQVAHEIKNPLTPMKLSLQFLEHAVAGKRAGLEILLTKTIRTVLEQIDTLSEIAGSFASFANMPAPKNEILDLSALLEQVLDLYQNNTEIDFSSDICAGPCLVEADASMLRQVFNNLILNAMQAVLQANMPAIQLRLSISSINERAQAIISITDNGQGIAESIRHKIFVPNFTTKYAGSGIGLALAKRGIEQAGGQIWFETQMNQGTSFFIQLPLISSKGLIDL